MATHDYIISNASGAAVRADLNNALAAIASNNSSATEPTTTYAYQWWADIGSSPTVMKLRNAANSAWITLFQLDGEWSNIAFENGTAAAPSIYFKDSGTDTGIYSPGADQVAISTNGTERMRIQNDGKVLIGTTSISGANYGTKLILSTNSGTNRWEVGPYNTATSFIIAPDTNYGVYLPNTTSTSWTSASDERIKTELEPIEDGLAKVATLRAVTGRFVFDKDGPRKVFLIAQDVLEVLPEAVDTSNPERYGLAYTEVIPLLVAALKESKERIETLETRLSALESA
jgi:hypothetical protein